MSRHQPKYVAEAGVLGSPLLYDWSKDIELKLYAAKDQNVKLCQALDGSNYRAKYSIGIAITEWIIWQFEKHARLDDAHSRIEAAWASAIDPAYAGDLKFKLTRTSVFNETAKIDGPMKLALNFLGSIDAHYATGNIYLAAAVVKQVVLARHVIAEREVLEQWISSTLRQCAQVFPRQVDYDTTTQKYDASHELPVPREFFEPGFTYTPETGKAVLLEFLKTLDYTKNPYLRSPEEMKENGFQGTPYLL
ncbi:MAG: hypothetical protein AB7P24_21040 [Nitrospira sp.]